MYVDLDKRRSTQRAYRAANLEKHLEWQKNFRDRRTPEDQAKHIAVVKRWREDNKEYVRAYKRRKYHETYARVQKLKADRGCARCPERHPAALDFHHESDDKEKAVSQMINKCGWEKLMVEIDKCTVLCANCHRKHHFELNTAKKKEITEREHGLLEQVDERWA